MRVTIVVTCFNQARWIEQALDSVAAQSEKRIQIVVTDDGSSDGSRETIERWATRHGVHIERVYSDANVGLPVMLNRAIPLLQGHYVVVANGDDWMEPERIRLQADALDAATSSVALAYSDLRVVDESGAPATGSTLSVADDRPEGQVLHRLIMDPFIGMPVVMFRRAVLDRIGPWDESLVADDYDFLLRVAAAGFEFVYVPGIVTNYRWYPTNMTRTRQGALAEGRVTALRKLLGRDPATDHVIYSRLQGLARAMHSMGYERRATRRHLRAALLHTPSPGLARALIENHLHLNAGALALRQHHRTSRD